MTLSLTEIESLIELVSEKKTNLYEDDDSYDYWEEIQTHLEDEYDRISEIN